MELLFLIILLIIAIPTAYAAIIGAPMSVSIMLSMAFMHACTANINKIAWALHADDLPNELHRPDKK